MYHRPPRAIITIVGVALLATTLGGAAEGKRSAERGLEPPTTALQVTEERAQWCANISNAPALHEAATDLRTTTPEDTRGLEVLDAASQRPMNVTAARRTGSDYAGLADRWSEWDRLCTAAYARHA